MGDVQCNRPWVDFTNPGPSLAELKQNNPKVYDAILRSVNGTNTIDDDFVVGNVCQGRAGGFCADPRFAATQYCACVNSQVPWPVCAFAPCNANEYAYKPVSFQNILKNHECPSGLVICENIVEYGGKGNVSQVYQDLNCGGVINNFISIFSSHPYLTVLLVFLVWLAMAISKKIPSGALPPPDLVFPGDLNAD